MVLALKCAVICHCSACHSVNHLSSVSALFISERHNVTYVTYFWLCRGLWVRMARKARWLAFCKIRPDVGNNPGSSGIQQFTYYYWDILNLFSSILNSKVVWVLERKANFSNHWEMLSMTWDVSRCTSFSKYSAMRYKNMKNIWRVVQSRQWFWETGVNPNLYQPLYGVCVWGGDLV